MNFESYDPRQSDPSEQPEGDPRFPYQDFYNGGQDRPPKKRHRWLWVLLILAAAILIAAPYVSLPEISVERTDRGLAVVVGKPETQPAEPDSDAPKTVTSAAEYLGTGQTLELHSSQESVPNTISSETGALSLQEIYRKVIPSVATVTTATRTGRSLGTGILMSSDGYLLTNQHVVEGGVGLTVTLENGEDYEAVLVASDRASDLAVLKIDGEGLSAAEFGDSDRLQVGDAVVAIGNPLSVGLRGTMTDGIISGISRDLTVSGRKMNLIQTNAALNNGNSGGPLINCYGQVVGINAVKLSSPYAATNVEGLGFAIPISSAKPIVDELIQHGYVSGRPALGISAEELPAEARVYFSLPKGAYVTYVSPESDAAAQGLRKGDIITALGGEAVTGVDSLRAAKNQYNAGDTVTLTIYRSGAPLTMDVKLMEQVEDQ